MIYVFGEYTYDTQLYELRRAGKLIHLGPQVFNVLAYLVRHRHRVIPKQELFERLWPGQFVGNDALERCIRTARRALGDTRHAPQLIQTICGRGYRFMAPVEVRQHDGAGDERLAAPSTPVIAATQTLEDADMAPPSLPVQVAAGTRRSTLSAPEGEHKPVTVVCCELAEARTLMICLGPEAMHHLMQALFALAQEVVQRYEGTIVEFGGDSFRVLFGADVAQEDHARRAVLAAALGAAYTWAGCVADAVPLLTRAMEQITAGAVVDFQAPCGLVLGEAQLRTGRLEKAHGLAEQALTLARERQERGSEAYAQRLLGDIAARHDPLTAELAEEDFLQALALTDELGMRPLQVHCHRDLGTLYAMTGQLAQARAELSTAIELYRAMDMTFWLPQAEAALAQVV